MENINQIDNLQITGLTPECKTLITDILSGNVTQKDVDVLKKMINKDDEEKKLKKHTRASKYTSSGKPKPKAAEPVRSKEDIKRIQDYFLDKEDYRDYCMFTVGISVGLRISDLLCLKISDIMNQDGTFKPYIDIMELKTDKESCNADDDCLLTKTAIDAIELYLCSLNEYDMNSCLFPSQKGEHLTERSAHKILKQMSRDLKLTYNVGTHTLRKTFAYWMLQLNPDDNNAIIYLQMLLKHGDLRSTLHYSGQTKDKTRELRNGLSDFYEGVM